MALLRRLDPLSHPRLCLAGRLFRSGSPAHAELEDVLLLRRELGVRHMLDFRSADEHQEDTAWSLMLSNGVIKTYDTAGSVTSVRMRGAGRGRWAGHERRVTAGRRRHGQPGAGADVCPPPALAVRPHHRHQVSVDHNAALHGVDLEDVQLHRISLMDRRRVMRGMMR